MVREKHCNHKQISKIAVACLSLAAPSILLAGPVLAADILINTPTTDSVILGEGDNLVVTETGSISNDSFFFNAISVTATNAGGISNSGLIDGPLGIHLGNSDISGGISNSGTIHDIDVNFSSDISGGIANSGIIDGLSGIRVMNNSDISGGVSNSGIIDGLASIHVTEDSDISGGVSNSGTIHVIDVGSSDISGGISNSGTIHGIDVNFGSDISGGVSNSGTIEGPRGIHVMNSSDISGGVSNSGTIHDIDVHFSSDISGGIANSGAIHDIDVGESSDISGGISNSGTIHDIYVHFSSDISGGINNSGTIAADGAGGYGIYVASGSNISGGITNLAGGIIRGTPVAITLNGGPGIVVNNSGLIDGIVELGNNTLNLDGTTARVTGTVAGDAGSTVNINGAFTSESNFIVNDFNVAGGGTFVTSDAITVTNAVNNAGIVAVTPGTTATITGNYIQSGEGFYEVRLASDASYGKLAVSGTADLTANNTIHVNVPISNALVQGTTFSDVLSAGTLTTGTLNITDSSYIWNFSGTIDGNTIDLTTTVSSAHPFAASLAASGNSAAAGVVRAFDAFINNGTAPSGDLGAIFSELTTLGSATEVGQALSQLLPGFAGGQGKIAINLANGGASRVVHRRTSGLSSGDPLFKDRMAWMQPFGAWTDQNARDGVDGYTADTHGLIVGADAKVSAQWRFGSAFSYAKGNVADDSPVTDNKLDIDTYQLTVYGTDQLNDTDSLNMQAAFGLNQNDSARRINFAGIDRVAAGDFSSWQASLDAEYARTCQLNEKATFVPFLRAQYNYVKTDDYSETGAGAANLAVASNSEDALMLSLGARGTYALKGNAKLTAHLSGGYDLLSGQSSVTTTFANGGPTFVTEGLEPSPFQIDSGVGLEVLQTNGIEVALGYDVQWREDFLNQIASLKFRVPF